MSEWTYVEDGFPPMETVDRSEIVWFLLGTEVVRLGYYVPRIHRWMLTTGHSVIAPVTHWQPLEVPKPPPQKPFMWPADY